MLSCVYFAKNRLFAFLFILFAEKVSKLEYVLVHLSDISKPYICVNNDFKLFTQFENVSSYQTVLLFIFLLK